MAPRRLRQHGRSYWRGRSNERLLHSFGAATPRRRRRLISRRRRRFYFAVVGLDHLARGLHVRSIVVACVATKSLLPPGRKRYPIRVAGSNRSLRPPTKAWLLSIWIELKDLHWTFDLKTGVRRTPNPPSYTLCAPIATLAHWWPWCLVETFNDPERRIRAALAVMELKAHHT